MADPISSIANTCDCGQPLPTAGAKRCVQCKAAHAQAGLKVRANALRQLPWRAPASSETTWVACSLGLRQVNVETAPSRMAVNLLSALKKDKKLRAQFWNTHLKMRLKRPYD